MQHVVSSWIGITLALAVMASMVIWSRRETLIRAAAFVFLLASAPAGIGALWITLGWPIPIVQGITALPGDYLVLGTKMVRGLGIFVLIDVGPGEPRYYRVPWSKDLANKIQDMLDSPESGGLMMNIKPFEWSWDQNAPQFWPLPQPKLLPDKPPQEEAPHFNPDSRGV